MASELQNLSQYDSVGMPDTKLIANQHFAIVIADWNAVVTLELLSGAKNTLLINGADEKNITVVHVPGTFELTYAASKLMKQIKNVAGQEEHLYDAIIVLGCVIQGETPHFDYVCSSVTQGITSLNLLPESCPVIFGVLTTNTLEQAKERAGGGLGNKGDEAAVTAIKMANIIWKSK